MHNTRMVFTSGILCYRRARLDLFSSRHESLVIATEIIMLLSLLTNGALHNYFRLPICNIILVLHDNLSNITITNTLFGISDDQL